MLSVKIAPDISFSLVYYWFKPLFKTIDAKYLYLFDWRDYFDLFYILKNTPYSLEEILAGAKKKFGVEFSPEQFLTQLTYFDDLKEFELQFVKRKYSQGEIKDFLQKVVENFAQKRIIKV